MSQQPFLPLFFGDFLASTAEWDGQEQALYLLLMGHQWTLGSLPADAQKLARLARWDRKAFDRSWPTVSQKFVTRDGRLVNERLEQHRAKAMALAEKNAASGRKGAEARWRNDGERHAERHSERHSPPNGDTHSNLSHPIPSQEREHAPPGLNPEAWERWHAYLAQMGKQLPQAQIESAQRAVAEYGPDQLAVVEQSIRSGWVTLFPPKRAAAQPAGTETAADREAAALRKLTDRRSAIGIPDFREPRPGEHSDAYRAAQEAECRAREKRPSPIAKVGTLTGRAP